MYPKKVTLYLPEIRRYELDVRNIQVDDLCDPVVGGMHCLGTGDGTD